MQKKLKPVPFPTEKEEYDYLKKEMKNLLEMENTIWGMDVHDRNRYEELKKALKKFLKKHPQFQI